MTPSKPPSPCATSGCPNDTVGTYCDRCQRDERERERRNESNRDSGDSSAYDATWQKLREKYISRNPLCERCRRRGETTPAEEVHHVIPIREDRHERLNPENLEALCRSCHARATRREDQFDRPRITLVCGPAGAGKTTFVRDRRSVGDLIVDVDLIWRSLGMLPMHLKPNEMTDAVLRTRGFILDYLKRPSQLDAAWVIATAPTPKKRRQLERRTRANETVVLAVDAETCKRRLRSDDSRQRDLSHHLSLVDLWWSEYEERDGERIITGETDL